MQAPVPVVRLIVKNSEGRVLILKRGRTEHAPGQWCLPGGKVEYGSSAESAALAELEEETGLKGLDPRFLSFQDSLPETPGGMHCINLYFECRGEGAVVLNHESADHRWIDSSEATEYPLVFGNGEALARYWSD